MNWQHFVSSAFLNSINFGTPRKLDLGICKPESEILDPGDVNGVPPSEKAPSMPDTSDSMYPTSGHSGGLAGTWPLPWRGVQRGREVAQ